MTECPSLLSRLSHHVERLSHPPRPALSGRVLRYDGLIAECAGFSAAPGTRCAVETEDGGTVTGEIVGFAHGRNLLFLDEPGARVVTNCAVHRLPDSGDIPVGGALLGRVIDADGAPLDAKPPPACTAHRKIRGAALNPMARQPVTTPLDCGVRLINAALTLGRGQRVGIVAGSGVGKSVLIEMIARSTEADVIIVGLIGERAREVGEFVSRVMSGPAQARTCVVAVPADRSPLLRLRAAQRMTAIAEHFREAGRDVLLIMDSLTRVAHARREIGLVLGEQPTAKGYPPSVVSMIPTLIERAGPGLAGEGSITAIYTILADGDDTTNDPVVDTARAILDGHIVLSRKQAQMGIYPAIDLTASVSRVMKDIVPADVNAQAARLRRLVALYLENRDMMLMGAYAPGHDAALDEAVQAWPRIEAFCAQAHGERVSLEESYAALEAVAGPGAGRQA
ncbi:MAG: FliI/YscN family ATPase [Pseudomonadota bacterium]